MVTRANANVCGAGGGHSYLAYTPYSHIMHRIKKRKNSVFCGSLPIKQVHNKCCMPDGSLDTACFVTQVVPTPAILEFLGVVSEQRRTSRNQMIVKRKNVHTSLFVTKRSICRKWEPQSIALFYGHIHVTTDNRGILSGNKLTLWFSFLAYVFLDHVWVLGERLIKLQIWI